MELGRFELLERVSELQPPLSTGERYVARCSQIYERNDGGAVLRRETVSEQWGVTEAAARAKLEAAFRKWVDSQPA